MLLCNDLALIIEGSGGFCAHLFINEVPEMLSNNDRLKEAVRNIIERPLEDEGCELADLSISQHKKGSTVRLFVYCENGTTIERCARLSSMVGAVIDGTEMFENGYTLEVSSPGLDRPLQKAMDFRYRIGETVKIQFAGEKRPSVKAKIKSVNDSDIEFENEAGAFTESLENIEMAKIVF